MGFVGVEDIPTTAANDSPLDHAIALRDRDTYEMVRRAIEAGDVALNYQPVVRADRPEEIAFHEGLIRVLDETGRTIPAKSFIDSIERTETGRRMDCIALQHGLAALRDDPGLRISINMSARSIGYAAWHRILGHALDQTPTLGERLILEITESSAMLMPELVVSFMDELQSRGVAFALDDFGSGYTAFRYFKDFFFDAVKIDGHFIRNIHEDSDNQVLTKALVGLARHFEMMIVAENVESPEEAAYLLSIGIDCLQGYLYGAPSATALAPLLPESRSA
ncbi:EAL domain-containing protein [Poseidonocella sedimentorum]|uniref:EAL domain, c-di-GMP-specific phosphodiesterase class I (Or its enzymatically inactive variant) n=1 Tax=Poseidonocella sedimentorum TaxID=871652 RepID=A0A1I6DA97_9RHOB|nr:EAL domain-containing protein [Poseidonocella sedimentorum]SFR02232.1 EAL domain, c-di-GMP-specific phosphodiesterase class I (or its enzymatically inactive variant) [Poseidonocella sedimentorum]